MARFVVMLSGEGEARWPDACLVTARPAPGAVSRVKTTGLRAWLNVLAWRARPASVVVPLTPRVATRLRVRRYVTTGVLLVVIALCTASVTEAVLGEGSRRGDGPSPWLGVIGAVVLAVAWLVAEAARPPAIDVVRRRGRLCVTFRQRALAFQTARMNGAEVEVRG